MDEPKVKRVFGDPEMKLAVDAFEEWLRTSGFPHEWKLAGSPERTIAIAAFHFGLDWAKKHPSKE